jgi:phage terminase large subunit GpA-like protein
MKDWVEAALGRLTPGAGYIQFPNWLGLDFYKELCVETRNLKGEWENPKKYRNESWDLLVYCYAICVYLRTEKFNWDSFVNHWASEWDDNVLVFGGDDESSVKLIKKGSDDIKDKLKKLAQQVG